MIPVDVQIREDAALGAAWRRAEAACAAVGWTFQHLTPPPGANPGHEYVAVAMGPEVSWCRTCGHADARDWLNPSGPTPTAALEALAELLGSRGG